MAKWVTCAISKGGGTYSAGAERGTVKMKKDTLFRRNGMAKRKPFRINRQLVVWGLCARESLSLRLQTKCSRVWAKTRNHKTVKLVDLWSQHLQNGEARGEKGHRMESVHDLRGGEKPRRKGGRGELWLERQARRGGVEKEWQETDAYKKVLAWCPSKGDLRKGR